MPFRGFLDCRIFIIFLKAILLISDSTTLLELEPMHKKNTFVGYPSTSHHSLDLARGVYFLENLFSSPHLKKKFSPEFATRRRIF